MSDLSKLPAALPPGKRKEHASIAAKGRKDRKVVFFGVLYVLSWPLFGMRLEPDHVGCHGAKFCRFRTQKTSSAVSVEWNEMRFAVKCLLFAGLLPAVGLVLWPAGSSQFSAAPRASEADYNPDKFHLVATNSAYNYSFTYDPRAADEWLFYHGHPMVTNLPLNPTRKTVKSSPAPTN